MRTVSTILALICGVFCSAQDSIQKKGALDKCLGVFEFNFKNAEMNTYPVIGYSPSSGLNMGITPIIVFPKSDSANRPNRPSVISAYFTYSTENWWRGHVDTRLFGKGFGFTAFLDFDLLEERYYGIGTKGQTSSYLNYETRFVNLQSDLTKLFSDKVSMGVALDFNYTRNIGIEEEGLAGMYVKGQKGGMVTGAGPVFIFDNRNDVYYPNNGNYLKSSVQFYPSVDANDYQYWRAFLDLRKYFALGKNWVFALQNYNDYSSGNVPFYKMAKIGTFKLLRGFEHRSKYVNSKMSLVQAELRKWMFWRIGVVGFAGAGNVFSDGFNDFKDDLKYVGGLGLRFKIRSNGSINMRADYGFASNGDRAFFLTIREAF